MKLQLEEMSKIRNLDLSSSITVQPAPQPTMKNHSMTEKKKRVRDSGGTRNVYESIKNYKKSAHHHNEHHSKNDLQPSVTITIQNPPSTSSATPMPAPVRGAKRKSTEKHEAAKSEKLLKKQAEERKEKELKEKEAAVPEVVLLKMDYHLIYL